MSVNIVLPPLSAWASSRLTGLLESKTQANFNTAFDDTFAANCTFCVNGQAVTREAYRDQLLAESAAGFEESGTTVTIEGVTQVETGNQGQLNGLVGLFYTALSDSKFLILGAPSEKRDTSSLNLVIEPTQKRPQQSVPFRGYFDPRRVTSVNQVVAESTYHATIPQASVPKTAVTAAATSPGKVELGPAKLEIPSSFGGLSRWQHPVRPSPVVRLPFGEAGTTREELPGDGEFGAGPVIFSGETLGKTNT